MTSGQTILSLTDLPFVYSIVNLMAIWVFGIPEDYGARFAFIGIIAGIGGTFLVFWHPIQSLIEYTTIKNYDKLSTYYIETPQNRPKAYDILIDKEYFRLSLKSNSIKYLKDKFTSQIYFVIVIGVFSIALSTNQFQKEINIENSQIIIPIIGILAVMAIALAYFSRNLYKQYKRSLKLDSLYYQFTKPFHSSETDMIKRSIDLQEWEIVEDQMNLLIRKQWANMDPHAKKRYDKL